MGNETSRLSPLDPLQHNSAYNNNQIRHKNSNVKLKKRASKATLDPTILPFDTSTSSVLPTLGSVPPSCETGRRSGDPITELSFSTPPPSQFIISNKNNTNNDNNNGHNNVNNNDNNNSDHQNKNRLLNNDTAAIDSNLSPTSLPQELPPLPPSTPPPMIRKKSKQPTRITSNSSTFTSQRRQSQRATSTISSHITDSNWTLSGGLFSQIDHTTSSTISSITNYSTFSKQSMLNHPDWSISDRNITITDPSMSQNNTSFNLTHEPPPYSTSSSKSTLSATTTTTASSSSSLSSTVNPNSLNNNSSSIHSHLSNINHMYSEKIQQLLEHLHQYSLNKISMTPSTSSSSTSIQNKISALLDQIFSLAHAIQNEDDKKRLYQLITSLSDQSITACVWKARCMLDGFGTDLQSRLGFETLLKLATSGHWEAYYPLALCYSEGVPNQKQINNNNNNTNHSLDQEIIQSINKQEEWKWLQLSAELNESSEFMLNMKARAQFKIGMIYLYGDSHITADHDKALHWLLQSAKNGYAYAQFVIGFHYEQGIKVKKDIQIAKQFYLSSAKQNFYDAQAAVGNILIAEQNYDEGLQWLTESAKMNNSRSLLTLGILSEYGRGVEKDQVKALEYYKASCELNNPIAHYFLGLHYRLGTLGLPQNFIEAGKHMTKSAKSGYLNAQRVLGTMYLNGLFLNLNNNNVNEQEIEINRRKSEKIALLWFRRAASQGDIRSLGFLASCYQYGRGTATNYEIALEYYKKAARVEGPTQVYAQLSLAQLLHQMRRYHDAVEWFTLAAENHPTQHPDDITLSDSSMAALPSTFNSHKSPSRTARLMLARYFLHGWQGVTKDTAKGFFMLKTLANESIEDANAHYWLAACYEEGIDDICPCNLKTAYDHYLIAANHGNTDAEFQVAWMLSNGRGIPKDRKAAYGWYKKAAEKNNKTALYSLGLYYAKGLDGIPKNLLQARQCFGKSARLGYVPAMTIYAKFCRDAWSQTGSHNNNSNQHQQQELCQQAVHWYQKAALQGEVEAQRELGLMFYAGFCVVRNLETAFNYLQQATNGKDAQATLLLGNFYEEGHYVEKDLNKSVNLYLDAEKLGSPIAPLAVAQVYHFMNRYEEAFSKYKKASTDFRLSQNHINTSKLMVARIVLSYVPSDDLDQIDNNNVPIESLDNMSKLDAFNILFDLANSTQFESSYYWLADCYYNGNGTEKSMPNAIVWYQKAADELKDAKAMFKLGTIYEQQDDPNTHAIGLHYYQLSADMEYPEAQHQLGMIHWRGNLGTTINLGESVIWFTRSAAQRYAASHWALGQMALENGDQDVAIVWWRKAIELKYAPAMRALARLLLQNNQINGDYNDNNNSELDHAMELLADAVEKNEAESLVMLGQVYHGMASSSSTTTTTTTSSRNNNNSNNNTNCNNSILSNKNSISSSTMNNVNSTNHNNNNNNNNNNIDKENQNNDHNDYDDTNSMNMDDTDVAAELLLQRQQQSQGLATRCFEQAAEMGHVESMFLAAESWHSQQQYAAALEYYEKAAQHGHLLAKVMCARYKLNGLGGMEINPSLGYKVIYILFIYNSIVFID
ncbi:unnamed protein product [Cunninghamella blakesleeana]